MKIEYSKQWPFHNVHEHILMPDRHLITWDVFARIELRVYWLLNGIQSSDAGSWLGTQIHSGHPFIYLFIAGPKLGLPSSCWTLGSDHMGISVGCQALQEDASLDWWQALEHRLGISYGAWCSVAKFSLSYGVGCRKKGFMLGVQDVGKSTMLIFELEIMGIARC